MAVPLLFDASSNSASILPYFSSDALTDEKYGNMLAELDDASKRSGTAMGVTRNSYLEFRARNIARRQGRLLSLDLVEKDIADQTIRDAWNLSDTSDFVSFAPHNETCDSRLLRMQAGGAEAIEESVEGHMAGTKERSNSDSARKGTRTIDLGSQKHGRQGND